METALSQLRETFRQWGAHRVPKMGAARAEIVGQFRNFVGNQRAVAGLLIIILVWVCYSAQILFLGTAFTRVYALSHGSHRNNEQATAAV